MTRRPISSPHRTRTTAPATPVFRMYTEALKGYLATPDEMRRHGARQVGRDALSRGCDMHDIAALHRGALLACLGVVASPGRKSEAGRLAAEFLEEALSPFEAIKGRYRGRVFATEVHAGAH